MFWICAGDSVDNIEMVLFYGLIVEQCLHRAKAFSAAAQTQPWPQTLRDIPAATQTQPRPPNAAAPRQMVME